LESMLLEISSVAQSMTTKLPEPPNDLLDRRQLVSALSDLQRLCPPELRNLVEQFAAALASDILPDYLSEEMRERIRNVISETRDTFARGQTLAEAYTVALQRNDSQREFDPVFKEALRREAAHDFKGSLELFRQLEKVQGADPDLRAMFRDHVTRNATIAKLMDELGKATAGGDFQAARQQLSALELSFPDIPFQQIVLLPLRIESQPAGAVLSCNGKLVGRTPCTIACIPAARNRLSVAAEGFLNLESEVRWGDDGVQLLRLQLPPEITIEHDTVVDAAPVVDADDITYIVDRAGCVTARGTIDGDAIWSYRSGDLSGLLSRVMRHGTLAVFSSLDGELRALDSRSGKCLWTLPGLPTQVAPIQAGDQVILATTDDRLCGVDLGTRKVRTFELGGSRKACLATAPGLVIAATATTAVACSLADFTAKWRIELPRVGERTVAVDGDTVVIVDDEGHVQCLDLATGVQRWQQDEPALILTPPMLAHDAVVLVARHNVLRLSLADGRRLHEEPIVDGECIGNPLRVGNRILVPTENGEVQVLDLATGRGLYCLPGGKRATTLLPWRDGVVIALPDHKLHFFSSLR
ncbi:MAG: PQQ-binding-like beta-propeller repeat protein, partial [Planctomycetes bacterium]|nr:PQQ-binding-like beta-propeller repeat protein [Planctomycetota bacterium]